MDDCLQEVRNMRYVLRGWINPFFVLAIAFGVAAVIKLIKGDD